MIMPEYTVTDFTVTHIYTEDGAHIVECDEDYREDD